MNLIEQAQPSNWTPLFLAPPSTLSPLQRAAQPLLGARDEQELKEWCDIQAPEMMAALAQAVGTDGIPPNPTQFQQIGPDSPMAISLGVERALPIYEQFTQFAKLVDHARAWALTLPQVEEPYLKVLRTNTAAVYDSETPSEVFECFLSFERGQVATYAILAAETLQVDLEDWKKDALRDLVVDGLRKWMLLLGSIPAMDVPEHLVPLSDRLDLPALYRRAGEARDAIRSKLG